MENEARIVRSTFRDSAAYIELIERELEKVHQQVIKLQGVVPNIEMLVILTPLAQIKKMRMKAQVDLNHAIGSKFPDVLSDKQRMMFT